MNLPLDKGLQQRELVGKRPIGGRADRRIRQLIGGDRSARRRSRRRRTRRRAKPVRGCGRRSRITFGDFRLARTARNSEISHRRDRREGAESGIDGRRPRAPARRCRARLRRRAEARATMRPRPSTTAEMPELAARTSGRPCSMARRRACAKCWCGPGVMPEPGIVGDIEHPAARASSGLKTEPSLLRKDRFVADERERVGQAGRMQDARGRRRRRTRRENG